MYVHMIDQLVVNKSTKSYVRKYTDFNLLNLHTQVYQFINPLQKIFAVIWLPNFVGSHRKIKLINFFKILC